VGTGFVFHDPSGKRWIRVQRAALVTAALLGVIGLLLGVALVTNPQLPSLGLSAVAHLGNRSEVRTIIGTEQTAKNVPFKKEIRFVKSLSPVIHQKIAARERSDQPLVFGYYVNWDPASIVSLRINLNHLTHLVPEWLTLANSQGDLADESDQTVIRIASDAHLPILAMVTNFRGGWQARDLHNVLSSPDHRADLVRNIRANLVEHKFAGVNIDFEELSERDRGLMVAFMSELRATLKPDGFVISEAVPADDPAYDLKRLAQLNDYIVPMVYDEHYQSGTPGPVASQDWFEKQLERLSQKLPAEKTVIGFGGYGYDWVIGDRGSTEVTFGDVIAAAGQNRARIEWDKDAQNPVLRYRRGAEQHEVWFLDAVTAVNQFAAIGDTGFRGMALWRLGAEDPGVWTVLKANQWPDEKFEPQSLFPLIANKSVGHYGSGDILYVSATPHDGNRHVWRTTDEDYEEQYETLPSYYVIEARGGPEEDDPKSLAITFDDGPDPEYTPQILDILKQKKVPATFFVVGVNAEEYPELLRRAYAEGHTIGNHTYSHPNIAALSEPATARELSMTQRLIEHAVGHSTTLFRPPYNADSEPQTPSEIAPILRAQNQNYVTVGERVDPRDWQPGVTAAQIVAEVASEKDNGHIILLHDAGGPREATVEALPKIIDTLRAQGYRFVSLPELMGKSRDQIMPLPGASELRLARLEGGALDFKGSAKLMIGTLFLLAICLTAGRSLIFGVLAIVQKWWSARRVFDPSFRPPVSVVIAAYNEEKVIAQTVRSVLANGYDDIEVVVVDDGSSDRTLDVLRAEFENDQRVRVFSQPNRGKSSALNHAITQSRCEVLVAVDADTIFRKGAIESLVRHFADSRVGAVSGNAKVGNRAKWITRFQSIEYVCGFNLDRRALDLLNAITVVPGAVGAWRKSLVGECGGFGHDTLAEDADLTIAIRRKGYQIRYEESAVAYTEAPETTSALARQRFRWAFGTLQAAWKHRAVTFDPRYGFLAFVAMPSIWTFQVLLAAVSPFAEIAMIASLFAGNWRMVLAYYFGFYVLEMGTAMLAYTLEGERPGDLKIYLFERIYFRQLMHFVLAKSVVFALKGRIVGWGKLERTASVEDVCCSR
jgi:peptidoglycan-N-acetylglucosamine deacetylase